eukprot:15064101-Ditylum_brightwellii.AAC.1
MYARTGSQLVSKEEVYSRSDILLKISRPTIDEIELCKPGTVIVGYHSPGGTGEEILSGKGADTAAEILEIAAKKNITLLSMDMVPRIITAQKLDSLSSMGKIAGYRAVIEAANSFEKFFTGEITASGKYPPAKVTVVGADVAGLAAIGAAKSLGAEV